jgi:hypothetical protein
MPKEIEYLVIHCSDSLWGDRTEITKWHKERGWKDIGYNGVILNGLVSHNSIYDKYKDGSFEVGRGLDLDKLVDPEEVGAHSLGYNTNSIGVCLIGKNKFTFNQFNTLLSFVRLFKAINLNIKIKGHYEMPQSGGKTCPNFDMNLFRALIDDPDKNIKDLMGKVM